jgi:hypothetical protein
VKQKTEDEIKNVYVVRKYLSRPMLYRKVWGWEELRPPLTTLLLSSSEDILFADDVAAILYLGVSFMSLVQPFLI